jgi:hypothetical protein
VDHYRLHETVANSAFEVRTFIDAVRQIAVDSKCDVYWRGQVDHRWGVRASLARLTETPTALRDPDLNAAETELLVDAKRWVTATPVRPSNDLEWLALLQHHWIPTRMLDFTVDPLIATFFAAEGLDDIEGRLFAIAIPTSEGTISDAEASSFKISQMAQGRVRLWQPNPAISPRFSAQNGVFVLGRLPSTYPARHVWDATMESERLMTRSEVVSVMSIPLYFVSTNRHRRPKSPAPSCFTVKIHVDKGSIREQLARQSNTGSLRPPDGPINHATCYPDTEGMNRFSRILKRVRRGLG